MIDAKQILPFYSYEFYRFDFRSAVLQGQNPEWESTQMYEIDYNLEFIDYMRNQSIRMDFCDESVEINNNTGKDYIGTAYIPLRNLLS